MSDATKTEGDVPFEAMTESQMKAKVRRKMYERAFRLLDGNNHSEACMLVDTASRLV